MSETEDTIERAAIQARIKVWMDAITMDIEDRKTIESLERLEAGADFNRKLDYLRGFNLRQAQEIEDRLESRRRYLTTGEV